MRILVIGGGISDERDVSLRSATSVFNAIGPAHTKYLYDWDGSTEWLEENALNYDVALPILHGVGGEDGQIQQILEDVALPYLGSGVAASQVCIDKVKTQAALKSAGVLVPEQAVVTRETYEGHSISQGPHVLKPVLGGSSLDTFVLKNGVLEDNLIQDVFSRYSEMILEECIIGAEITVPILDGYDLPVIGIVPDGKYEFFDFEAKYDGSTAEICNPDFIEQSVQKSARELSRRSHNILGCRHLSRVDIMLDQNNTPYVIEINTMPGLTDQSLFPGAAAYVGLSMPELVEYFIKLVSDQTTS